MARATTRRARNGWLSARLFATLAMVFATLATPGAAGGQAHAALQQHQLLQHLSHTPARARRRTLRKNAQGLWAPLGPNAQTLEPSARGSLATRSRPTRGLFQRSPPSPSDSTSLSSWPKSDVDAT